MNVPSFSPRKMKKNKNSLKSWNWTRIHSLTQKILSLGQFQSSLRNHGRISFCSGPCAHIAQEKNTRKSYPQTISLPSLLYMSPADLSAISYTSLHITWYTWKEKDGTKYNDEVRICSYIRYKLPSFHFFRSKRVWDFQPPLISCIYISPFWSFCPWLAPFV